jgi:hypothetical protein
MQPEPTEISTPHTQTPAQEQPAITPQYGFQSPDLQPHGSLSEQQTASPASSPSSDARHASVDHDIATRQPLLGLIVDVAREDHTKPAVHRIFEHENALKSLSQKKLFEGPYFKVVKSGSTLNGPRLEDFPNGISVLDSFIRAIH